VKDFPANLAFRQPLSRCSLRADLCAVLALGMLVLGAPGLRSQTPVRPGVKPGSKSAASSAASKIAAIKSFRIVQEEDGPALEILSTEPLIPSIQAIGDPDRLVIDLPNARVETEQKRISVQNDQITSIRADQFQQDPPVARLVVDLLAPRTYSWDAAGNRLVVHLGKNPGTENGSPFQSETVPSLTPAPQPVVAAVRAAGPLRWLEMTEARVLRLQPGPIPPFSACRVAARCMFVREQPCR
jgi:hypothetical protein